MILWHILHQLQNEGEIDFFTVNKLNNDNDKAENIWTLTTPETHDWAEGRAEVKSDGELEYQVNNECIRLVWYIMKREIV